MIASNYGVEVQHAELVFFDGHCELAFVSFAVIKSRDLQPGERWITVNADKGEGKGQHVLVRESPGRPGVFHVIAGLGGRVNYLKLTDVKSHEHYKAQAKERAKDSRAKAREQVQRDKELGLVESKKQALGVLKTDTEKQQRNLIEQVAQLKGWDDYDLKPEHLAGLSDRAKQAALLKHHRQLHRDAEAVVKATREQLLLDAEARAEAELGELSIHRDEPNVLGLTDLSPDPQSRGLGYQPDYGPKTEAIQEEAQAWRVARDAERDPQKREAVSRMHEVTQEAKQEVDQAVQEGRLSFGGRDVSPVQATEAVKLLTAHKQAKATIKRLAARKKEIQGATTQVQPKTYVVEAEPISPKDVYKDLLSDAAERTRLDRARSFLKMVESDPLGEQPEAVHDQLHRHVQVGASTMLSRVSQQLTGVDILPREVVDVLGTAGAAQAMAVALQEHFSPEQITQWAEQLGQYHASTQAAVTEEAVNRAKEAYGQAAEMVETTVEQPSDLAVVRELNEKRIAKLTEAREVLGTTLGELEAMAAVQLALSSKPITDTMVSMGGVSTETAIRQLKALGLEKDDYDLDSDGTNHFAAISRAGLAKIAKPVDPEEVAHLQKVNDILEGKHDEPGWLPAGFARRSKTDFTDPEQQAVGYSRPYDYSASGAHDDDLKRYIGRRMADGHPIHGIYRDLFSGTVLDHIPADEHAAYFQALERVAPLYDDKGKARPAESHREAWESLAETAVAHDYGSEAAPIHRQRLNMDSPKTLEAMHRVLAADPVRKVAFTRIGELTSQEQATLRHVFETRFARPEQQSAVQGALEELGDEPAKETEGLFGAQENPEWHQWQSRKQQIMQDAAAKGLSWEKYVKLHGSRQRAYQALQDIIRGEAVEHFAKEYGRVHRQPLKLGRTTVTNHLAHLDAVNPSAREARLAEHRDLVDKLRNRAGGRYAGGSVKDKLDRARELHAIADQNQRSMFAVQPEDQRNEETTLSEDERRTLGRTAETQLEAMWGQVARNFDPQRPVKLATDLSMDGKFVGQQRAVKLIEHNKRMALALGVGSGKTNIGLGAFTHLHSQGKVKRGVFAVPSIVQAQFGAEAAAALEPGKYSWWGQPGADREARVAALKDSSHHMVISTHQALRDDLVHLMAKHHGKSEEAMTEQFQGASSDEQAQLMKEMLDAEGIQPDYVMLDEGHEALDRAGKADSLLSNVMDAFHRHAPYYVSASADPLKNDLTELHSQLQKIDPVKFSSRSSFMGKYGLNTNASQDILRRELRRYLLPGRVHPGVEAIHHEEPVSLSEAQQKAYDQVMTDYRAIRQARQRGTIDLEAAKRLSPNSFDGVPPEQHEEIAKGLHENVGIVRDGALERVINDHPKDNAKLQHVVNLAERYKADGQPGIIFARSRKAVQSISDQLKKAGHRVLSLTGSDSAQEKGRKITQFRPPPGQEPSADVMVLSDAGATGANLQRGKWVVHYDIPHTSKTWHQRTGRIHRLGQTSDVRVHTLLTDTHLDAKKLQRLNRKHGLREILTSPYEAVTDEHPLYTVMRGMHADE